MNLEVWGGRRGFDDHGMAWLELDIAGWPAHPDGTSAGRARIPIEDSASRPALRAGYIFMGAEAEGFLPALPLPPDPEAGRYEVHRLEGFTDDPAVRWLFNEAEEAIEAGLDYERELTAVDLAEAVKARKGVL